MTPNSQLIITVRSVDEAELVLSQREIAASDSVRRLALDVKDPALGSLGRPRPFDVDQIISVNRGRLPLSVAWGELAEPYVDPPRAWSGSVRYLKLGLAGMSSQSDWQLQWAETLRRLQGVGDTVAVIYADWRQCLAPPPHEVILSARQFGCRVVLIDTCDKSRGSLWNLAPVAEVSQWVQAIHNCGLLAAVAGSLTLADLGESALPPADFVALRGALCGAHRSQAIDRSLLAVALRTWGGRYSAPH